MASGVRGSKRTRGEIEELASGALRVKVYAAIDPISKKRLYLRETVPAGPNAQREAEKEGPHTLTQRGLRASQSAHRCDSGAVD